MRTLIMSLAIAGIAALTACGGGGSTSSTPPNPIPTPAPTTSSTDPTLPKQTTQSNKTFWETQGGLPLYTFGSDTAGVSNCTGSCATVWPPLMSGSTSTATGSFTIITRTNPSGSQWAYNGMALYTFASDTANQPPTGDGVQNFHLAIVNGATGGSTPPPGCTGIYC